MARPELHNHPQRLRAASNYGRVNRNGDRSAVCQLLREDPDLAEAIPPPLRPRALEECIAPVARIRRGPWNGERTNLSPDAIGLLVLDGLLIRRVGIDGRFGAELLGEGDILRPWQVEAVPPILARTTGWRALQQTRVAVLDERVAQRLARYPQLTGRLVGRALERSRNLAINMAIVHQPRVDVRLRMLFWHFAGRWGTVTRDGVLVPLQLTHTVLADLAAARRPTVTTALAELARQELLTWVGDHWLLRGEPPGELLELGAAALETTVPAPAAGP
jgi:CRP/FNR family transcriptional regulator, cyclic AMP receptor protein